MHDAHGILAAWRGRRSGGGSAWWPSRSCSSCCYLSLLIRLTRNGRRTFFEKEQFPWVEHLEANWPVIRKELDSVLTRIDLIPNFQDIQIEQRMITYDDGWKTFFCGYGERAEKNIARCPETKPDFDDPRPDHRVLLHPQAEEAAPATPRPVQRRAPLSPRAEGSEGRGNGAGSTWAATCGTGPKARV